MGEEDHDDVQDNKDRQPPNEIPFSCLVMGKTHGKHSAHSAANKAEPKQSIVSEMLV